MVLTSCGTLGVSTPSVVLAKTRRCLALGITGTPLEAQEGDAAVDAVREAGANALGRALVGVHRADHCAITGDDFKAVYSCGRSLPRDIGELVRPCTYAGGRRANLALAVAVSCTATIGSEGRLAIGRSPTNGLRNEKDGQAALV